MSLSKSKLISYEEYLNTLTQKELTAFLDTLEIEYNSKAPIADLIALILEELDDIIYKVLSYLTLEEYRMIKYIIKQNGNIKLRTNVGLMKFCEYLTSHHLMYKIEEKKYGLFKEVYNIFKVKIKQKRVLKKCKKNSNEFHLIMGSLLGYGARNLKDFYNIYCEKYEMTENGLKEYLISLERYNNSFGIYEDKDNIYLANIKVNDIKECQRYADAQDKAKYSASEIQGLYTLNYMKKYKSYRKLRKFINDSYYIEKDNFKVVVERILIPFLEEYQISRQNDNKLLEDLFADYFEFNSKKHQERFLNLVNELAKDYPKWVLGGYSEREKEK